jgi:hypothetical protein
MSTLPQRKAESWQADTQLGLIAIKFKLARDSTLLVACGTGPIAQPFTEGSPRTPWKSDYLSRRTTTNVAVAVCWRACVITAELSDLPADMLEILTIRTATQKSIKRWKRVSRHRTNQIDILEGFSVWTR